MEYRVLARKYRPATFADLVGQEVLVRTLGNAFKTGRIAHAFLLTGIRGIGKTTTARIIARALNCIGPDGNGGPTTQPCGVCTHCQMIAADRHPDVLEMDAASRTGVDAMRDLIEGVRYLPSSARTKVYIIDEVHMLSGSAFNALLKTLEEPPPHVKFIFATTEVRKIPVTILSRCQRFDLKRLDTEGLAKHLGNVAAKENIAITSEALTLLSIAAEGSVRDGLSLLDQAIAHRQEEGEITANQIRTMLGLADRTRVFALLNALFTGEISACLEVCNRLYMSGADPLLILQDALETVHFVTRVKLSPAAADDPAYSEQERNEAKKLAERLGMPELTRAWQMLLKGVNEVRYAPSPIVAAEMVLIRLAYASALPTPLEALKNTPPVSANANNAPMAVPPQARPLQAVPRSAPMAAAAPAQSASVQATMEPMPQSFEEMVKLFERKKEALIASQLRQFASVASFTPGRMELFIHMAVPRDFTTRLAGHLKEWTGMAWTIALCQEDPGEPTMQQMDEIAQRLQLEQARKHALVQSVMEEFPGAELVELTPVE